LLFRFWCSLGESGRIGTKDWNCCCSPDIFSASFEWSMRLGAAYAQTSRGTVTGTVLDSSGATRGVDMADTGDKIAGPTS
jgi:hypothetical protein